MTDGKELIGDWKSYYGDNPYSDTEIGIETPPEVTAKSIIGALEEVKVTDRMKNGTLNIFFSSASKGDIPDAFSKQVAEKGFKPQNILVSDFAVTSQGIPTVQAREHDANKISYLPLTADSFHLPLQDDSLDVIHERLGALFHAVEVGQKAVEDIVHEYVLKKGGVLLIDHEHTNDRIVSSTTRDIKKVANIDELFKDAGFTVTDTTSDKDEKYMILSKE